MDTARPATRALTAFGSHGVSARLVAHTEHAQVLHAEFAPGGVLGRHPAATWQTLAVVAGSGWSSGDDGVRHPLGPGELVRFAPGEEHETGSEDGMLAVIVETATPAG